MSTDYMLKKSTHYHIVNLFLDSDTAKHYLLDSANNYMISTMWKSHASLVPGEARGKLEAPL